MIRAAQRNIIVYLTDGKAYKLYGLELRLQQIWSQHSLYYLLCLIFYFVSAICFLSTALKALLQEFIGQRIYIFH